MPFRLCIQLFLKRKKGVSRSYDIQHSTDTLQVNWTEYTNDGTKVLDTAAFVAKEQSLSPVTSSNSGSTPSETDSARA